MLNTLVLLLKCGFLLYTSLVNNNNKLNVINRAGNKSYNVNCANDNVSLPANLYLYSN